MEFCTCSYNDNLIILKLYSPPNPAAPAGPLPWVHPLIALMRAHRRAQRRRRSGGGDATVGNPTLIIKPALPTWASPSPLPPPSPSLGNPASLGPPPLIPPAWGGREPLQPWESFPVAVPAPPSAPDRPPALPPIRPGSFSLTPSTNECMRHPYLASCLKHRRFLSLLTTGIARDLPRFARPAGRWLWTSGRFSPLYFYMAVLGTMLITIPWVFSSHVLLDPL